MPVHGGIAIDDWIFRGFAESAVAHTAIYLSPENLTLIFCKFSQSGPSLPSFGKTKFKSGGSDLNLPITRGIIEAHGGTILFESEGCEVFISPGSTFHLLTPARTDPAFPKTEQLFGKLQEEQPQTDAQENPSADSPAA